LERFFPVNETDRRALHGFVPRTPPHPMTESLALIPSAVESQLNRDAAFREFREMVLHSVASEHSKRNYAKPLDELYALREERKQPLSRALLIEYRAAMLEKRVSASTVNVQLSPFAS
jgi:hypothetical protein